MLLFSYSLSRALLNSMPLPGRNCDNWTIKMSQVSLNTALVDFTSCAFTLPVSFQYWKINFCFDL